MTAPTEATSRLRHRATPLSDFQRQNVQNYTPVISEPHRPITEEIRMPLLPECPNDGKPIHDGAWICSPLDRRQHPEPITATSKDQPMGSQQTPTLRNAAPDLIAENARLRRERDDLMHGTSEFVANTVSRQTAALGAEVERLRRERDEARAQRDEWREVVASLGFGDGRTEPQATPEQFQHAMERTLSDQSEWHESQLWRDDCAMAGHPDDEDCAVHDPAIRLLDAETENEYLRLAGETVVAENDALRAQVARVEAELDEQVDEWGVPYPWVRQVRRALTDAAPPATPRLCPRHRPVLAALAARLGKAHHGPRITRRAAEQYRRQCPQCQETT